MLTAETLRKIGTSSSSASNMTSIVVALNQFGPGIDLTQPHRIAHYVAQLAHESGGFVYDKELWGPTAAQKGYEGRKDLGNTVSGDGYRFRGRGPLQLTGRANYRAFTAWARKTFASMSVPDFEASPDLVNTDPWEGLVPIWYWDQRDEMLGLSSASSMNALADKNDIETITRRVNGGLNGYADRCSYYQKIALVLLGYGAGEVQLFQANAKKAGLYSGPIDSGGPGTRAAMHAMLKTLPSVVAAPGIATPEPDPVPPVPAEPTLASIDARVRNLEGAVAQLIDASRAA